MNFRRYLNKIQRKTEVNQDVSKEIKTKVNQDVSKEIKIGLIATIRILLYMKLLA